MITHNQIQNAMVSPVREIYARVELYEGSTLFETCNCHDRLISLNIQRTGDMSKFWGFGICQRLNFHLIDKNRELNLTTATTARVSYTIDGVNYIYPYPDFHITEVNRDENTNELSVTAYDALHKADLHYMSEVTVLESMSIYDYVEAMATILPNMENAIQTKGFPEDDISMVATLPLLANFEGTESFREALDDAAEATMSIYYLDKDNILTFKRLDKDGDAALAITKSEYVTLSSKTNRRLSAICRATELGDNVTATLDVSGTTQYIRDNAFWDNRDDIADVLETALDMMGGFTINQFDCFWRGNVLLEIGDKIALTTKDNGTAYSYVIDDIITYNGALTEVTTWTYTAEETETHSNPTTIGEKLKQTYAKVDKVNQQIDIVAGEVASIKLNNEQITQTVQRVDAEMDEVVAQVESKLSADELEIAVQKVVEEGVERVTTTTGYSFNEEGLRITKSESQMDTLITEDGVKIFRDGEEVLVADNLGVKAEDLHATTFLIIGDNSRLENYLRDRTGCYYIGGKGALE